jgi:hypothetical protein
LGKRFSGMFFGGDAKTAGNYVLFDVMLPAAKDLIVDAGSQMIERMIFGETRRGRRGATPPQSGPQGVFSYNRQFAGGQQQTPQISRRGRQQHDFDEIVLATRGEAEEVLEMMGELLSRWDQVSVADLYSMVGIKPSHVDNKWGWVNIQSAGLSRLRGGNGYVLDLPEPQPL